MHMEAHRKMLLGSVRPVRRKHECFLIKYFGNRRQPSGEPLLL